MDSKIKKYSNDKLIVFDMIGTLTTNPHLISQVFHLTFPSIDINLVRKYYKNYKLGKISQKQFWKGIGFDNFSTQETRFLGNLALKQGVIEMLEVLKKHYKLALFSNIPKEWGHYIEEKYKFDEIFDAIIFSGDYGLQKPEKPIYEVLMNNFPDINPERMYLIDDDLEDLKTAKDFSMKTIWLEREQCCEDFKADYIIQDLFEIIDVVKK